MGHNYYGEPAWPNDLLYIFPVVILGTFACIVGLAVLDPAMLADKADPFATPLEILPEWYLYPVFQILRVVPNKLLGIEGYEGIKTGTTTPAGCCRWSLPTPSSRTTRSRSGTAGSWALPGRPRQRPSGRHRSRAGWAGTC
jgi:hypothetical protein